MRDGSIDSQGKHAITTDLLTPAYLKCVCSWHVSWTTQVSYGAQFTMSCSYKTDNITAGYTGNITEYIMNLHDTAYVDLCRVLINTK